MQRTYYLARLETPEGAELATATAYAWNSGARASEGLVRDRARAEGTTYSAAAAAVVIGPDGLICRPDAPGARYARVWSSDATGARVVATVARAPWDGLGCLEPGCRRAAAGEVHNAEGFPRPVCSAHMTAVGA